MMKQSDFVNYATMDIAKLFLEHAPEETKGKLNQKEYNVTHRDKSLYDLFAHHLSKVEFYEVFENLPQRVQCIIEKELEVIK